MKTYMIREAVIEQSGPFIFVSFKDGATYKHCPDNRIYRVDLRDGHPTDVNATPAEKKAVTIALINCYHGLIDFN